MARRPLVRLLDRPGARRRAHRTRWPSLPPRPPPAPTAATAAAAARRTWKPRPAQYPGRRSVKDLAIPMSDGVKLRGDLTLPANADGTPIGAKVPVDRDDHRLQQDRHRRRVRRHAGRRRPGVPRQARLRPAHRRRARHRLLRGAVERVRRARGQGRRRGDDLGPRAAVEQRQHRDDRRLLHGHQPDLRRRRQARRAQGDLPAGPRRPTSTATWSPRAARSTPASCRSGSAWSPPPA